MGPNKDLEYLLASLDPSMGQQPLPPMGLGEFQPQPVVAEQKPASFPDLMAPPGLDMPKAKAPEPSPMMPEQTQTMQPMVKDYLSKKFNLGDYSDEKRKGLIDENSKYDLGGRATAALAALGAGFQGRDSAQAGGSVLNRLEKEKENKLEQFDKGRQNLIANYDLDRKVMDNEKKDDLFARENALDSQETMLAQSLAKKMLPEMDFSTMTASQINEKIPSLKGMYDIEQRKLDRQDAREERRALFGMRQREMDQARDEKRQDKLDQLARPSDKQIEAFTDFDNAESDLTNLLGSLSNNSNWTGPVDGRVPDMLVGDDQVAWRSAVGKYKDAYRKAITGAGAGPREIAILEKRLPSETDTYDNFVSKAKEAQQELKRRKQTLAENLKKGGKNVDQFLSPSEAPQEQTKVVDGVTYRKVPGGWEEM